MSGQLASNASTIHTSGQFLVLQNLGFWSFSAVFGAVCLPCSKKNRAQTLRCGLFRDCWERQLLLQSGFVEPSARLEDGKKRAFFWSFCSRFSSSEISCQK